jgi:hypothetical protein
MPRRLGLAAFFFLLSGCASPSVRYARGVIKIRTAPSMNAPIVRETFENERLEYSLIQGGWYRLKGNVGTYEQWAHIGFLNTFEEELARRCRDASLRVEKWQWKPKGGEVAASGKVTNISTRTLKNVAARIEYHDNKGGVLASDSQLVDSVTIPPGQTVSFKVTSSYKPGMVAAAVSFTSLTAIEIPSCRTPQ